MPFFYPLGGVVAMAVLPVLLDAKCRVCLFSALLLGRTEIRAWGLALSSSSRFQKICVSGLRERAVAARNALLFPGPLRLEA